MAAKKPKKPKPAKAAKAPKAPKAPKADVPPRFFLNTFPFVTAWVVIGIVMVMSFSAFITSLYYYTQFSTSQYNASFSDIHEIGQLLAVAYRHREYYPGNLPTVAQGVSQLFVYSENKKAQLEAKKVYYNELFQSGSRVLYGWQTYGQNRYYISKGKKTWNNAQKFCTDRNAHLASIHSAEEQKFITTQLKQPAWIGLTDKEEEGRWRWSDDSWFTTQYWADGEPSDDEGPQAQQQDCTSIVPSGTDYNWKDDRCDQLHHWVCKQFRG